MLLKFFSGNFESGKYIFTCILFYPCSIKSVRVGPKNLGPKLDLAPKETKVATYKALFLFCLIEV